MRAYSEDLRERIVEAVDDGLRPVEVAERFKVSLASVKRYVKQKREQGHLRFEQPPGRPRRQALGARGSLRRQAPGALARPDR